MFYHAMPNKSLVQVEGLHEIPSGCEWTESTVKLSKKKMKVSRIVDGKLIVKDS